MRIGLAYNEKPDSAPDAESDCTGDAFAEWDDVSTITAVEQALGLFGSVIRLEADQVFPHKVVLARPDLVFNMAEGLHGQSREALVPAICEYLNIPYTGSDPLTLALSLHKGRTKETLAYRGVPTAPFACIEAPGQIERMALTYPVFVKPVAEGSGKGVFASNLCANVAALRERARFLLERYAEPVLVETYLPGPEFTLAIFQCPARVPAALYREIERTALEAYHALGCRDWCRVDLRVDRFGVPNVLELNPLPGVLPDPAMNSCFPKAARAAGFGYDELIQEVVRIAWRRLTGQELTVDAGTRRAVPAEQRAVVGA